METRGPYMLDDDTWRVLVDTMGATMRWSAAADAAGISRQTMRVWRRRAESGEEPYARLVTEMKQAKAGHQRYLMEQLQEQGERSWQAVAWLLERTAPEEYGMVAALRPETAEGMVETSRESRLAQLREHWRAVHPDDEASNADG